MAAAGDRGASQGQGRFRVPRAASRLFRDRRSRCAAGNRVRIRPTFRNRGRMTQTTPPSRSAGRRPAIYYLHPAKAEFRAPGRAAGQPDSPRTGRPRCAPATASGSDPVSGTGDDGPKLHRRRRSRRWPAASSSRGPVAASGPLGMVAASDRPSSPGKGGSRVPGRPGGQPDSPRPAVPLRAGDRGPDQGHLPEQATMTQTTSADDRCGP